MFTRTAIALAIVFAVTAAASASQRTPGTNPAWGAYDSQGNWIGSGPEPRSGIRARDTAPDYQLRRWNEFGKR